MTVRPRPLQACQRCASTELRMAGLRDGVIVGLGQDLSRMACDRCGLVAVPLEFEDAEALRAFEKARSKDPSKTWPPSGWPSIKGMDKP